MNNFNEFRDKHNCLFIEDRVQGHISSYSGDI